MWIRRIDMIDKSKLYYLSHPYTTHGNIEKNRVKALIIGMALNELHNLSIVNPIVTLPTGLDDGEAMRKCRHLYNACDALILCKDWEKSKGCNEEYWWAVADKKPIYLLEKLQENSNLSYKLTVIYSKTA
jgi:hypothetical protein